MISNTKEHWGEKYKRVPENYWKSDWRLILYKWALEDIGDDRCSIIDIGSGLGYGLEEIKKNKSNANVFGVDFSREAKKKSVVPCIQKDIVTDDLSKLSADYVLCIETLEHFMDPHYALDRILPIARKKMILTVPYKEDISNHPEHEFVFSKRTFRKYPVEKIEIKKRGLGKIMKVVITASKKNTVLYKLRERRYWLWASYRRQLLDDFQENYKALYHGVVLDIGGRDRGKFVKPKDKVDRWIFADIQKKYNADIILDVTRMDAIKDASVDVVNAIELFEHVEAINEGLKECYRVLKKGGTMLISVPFLYSVHADPYDFQRWTAEKWKFRLGKIGFTIKKLEVTGLFFTVLADMVKMLAKQLPNKFQILRSPIYHLLDMIVKLDDKSWVKNNNKLNKYHGGYFIITKKN